MFTSIDAPFPDPRIPAVLVKLIVGEELTPDELWAVVLEMLRGWRRAAPRPPSAPTPR
jgi:hypothetical protein